MNTLKRKFKVYFPFLSSTVEAHITYRINFLMFVLGNLMQTFVAYYLWKAIFLSSTKRTLSGFTFQNMVIYIFISAVTGRFVISGADGIVSEEVKDGSISMNLIKPISYHFRVLFNLLGEACYNFIFVGLPLWIGLIVVRYLTVRELPPSLSTILIYLLSMVFSFIILFLFDFCFGLLAFFVTNTWGLRRLKNGLIAFLSGQVIPLAFFPGWCHKILNAIPFGSIYYTPVMVYLKKLHGTVLIKGLGIQLLWIFILLLVVKWLWNKAINRLTILGG